MNVPSPSKQMVCERNLNLSSNALSSQANVVGVFKQGLIVRANVEGDGKTLAAICTQLRSSQCCQPFTFSVECLPNMPCDLRDLVVEACCCHVYLGGYKN